MVSVLQPFFTGASMAYNQQQQEDEAYAQYWSQFAAATYPPTSQSASAPLQVSVPTIQSQPGWNDNFAMGTTYAQGSFYEEPQSMYPQQAEYLMPPTQSASLPPSQVPSYQSSPAMTYSTPMVPSRPSFSSELTVPSSSSHPHRHSRGLSTHSMDSYTSTAADSPEASESNFSRSSSPGSADMSQYGYLNQQGTWSCAYPGCTSRAVFTRGCDLRKHHKRHTKSFFCRYPGCSQASGGGFSSKKDLARHEAKHNPGVVCEWEGCNRIFSRVDNMRDHVKRIHLKAVKRASAARASPTTSSQQ